MTWEELQEYLKGKLFLIGLTFVNKKGNLIEHYQTHGHVFELTDNGLIRIKKDNNSVFQIPYDRENINKADKGKYKEKSTGKIIKNPDYIMSWEVIMEENDRIAEIKESGFTTED